MCAGRIGEKQPFASVRRLQVKHHLGGMRRERLPGAWCFPLS